MNKLRRHGNRPDGDDDDDDASEKLRQDSHTSSGESTSLEATPQSLISSL